jgi:hypothetical protein
LLTNFSHRVWGKLKVCMAIRQYARSSASPVIGLTSATPAIDRPELERSLIEQRHIAQRYKHDASE